MYFHGSVSNYATGETSRSADEMILLDFPTRIPDLPAEWGAVQSVAAGHEHVLAVIGGKLYGYGSNKFQCLHPNLGQGANTFVALPPIAGAQSPPAQVACGQRHSIVRLVDGTLFSCGDNSFSQLGHTGRGRNDAVCPWRRVAIDEPMSKIYAAGNCSFALSGGRVFSWGCQQYGGLGHGTRGEVERMTSGKADEFKDVDTPKLVQWFAQQRVSIIELAPSKTHTVAMSATDVYVFGEGAYHKLGFGTCMDELFPRRLVFPPTDHLEKIEAVGAADDHTVVLKSSQLLGAIIYLVGKDGGSDQEWQKPQRLALPSRIEAPRDIVSGPGHFYLTTQTGQVFCYGRAVSGTAVNTLGLSGRDRDQRGLRAVTPLAGLAVRRIIEMRSGTFWICDDGQRGPQRASLDVMVDKGDRYPVMVRRLLKKQRLEGNLASNKRADPDFYEKNVLRFYQLWLGSAEAGLARFGRLPIAAAEAKIDDFYQKCGASSLHVGSHVRVWMTDVYALGTISMRDVPGLGKDHFEVTWVREDWEAEILELHSDDEGVEELNGNRWQKLWFPTWEE